jgi:hypothetical protein
MTRARGFARIGLGSVRWLLPWIGVLLVSVSLASATNGAVTGSWPTTDGRAERSGTPVVDAGSPSGATGNVDEAQAADLACISRFAAYTSVSEAVRRCSTLVIREPARMAPSPASLR